MNRRTILLQDAESLLARALRRLFPPTVTVWNSVCMDCDRVYGVQNLPYDERHGREVNSHGLCVSCAADRGVLDLDTLADGRLGVARRHGIGIGDVTAGPSIVVREARRLAEEEK
jgi:hypothetical protein